MGRGGECDRAAGIVGLGCVPDPNPVSPGDTCRRRFVTRYLSALEVDGVVGAAGA
jgi:hypothetical protein